MTNSKGKKGWRRYKVKRLGSYCGKSPNDPYRKYKYPNIYLAMKACAEMMTRRNNTHHSRANSALHVYECGCCGGIHIGHLFSDERFLYFENDEPIDVRAAQGLP